MPTFVFRGEIEANQLERREEVRNEHLEYNLERDMLAAGPLTDDDGTATGSFIIFEADDRAAAKDRVANDPYITSGVVGAYTVDLFVRAIWPE